MIASHSTFTATIVVIATLIAFGGSSLSAQVVDAKEEIIATSKVAMDAQHPIEDQENVPCEPAEEQSWLLKADSSVFTLCRYWLNVYFFVNTSGFPAPLCFNAGSADLTKDFRIISIFNHDLIARQHRWGKKPIYYLLSKIGFEQVETESLACARGIKVARLTSSAQSIKGTFYLPRGVLPSTLYPPRTVVYVVGVDRKTRQTSCDPISP